MEQNKLIKSISQIQKDEAHYLTVNFQLLHQKQIQQFPVGVGCIKVKSYNTTSYNPTKFYKHISRLIIKHTI